MCNINYALGVSLNAGLVPQLVRGLVLADSLYLQESCQPKDAASAAFTRCRKVMPEFPAITHVALTVTSLERSVPWYKALFGSEPILDEDTGPFKRVAWLASDTIVGLTQFPDLNSTQPFNERRPGLDHLAFGCANRDELEAWEIRLNELGIRNGGIVDTPSYSALSFRDPDNIALEFFAPRG
jgi:glyoxylase I family protein